jgi:NADH-quinone oxidoreductase subunit H
MTSLGGLGMYGVGGDGIGTLSMIQIVKSQQAQHVWFLFKFFPLGAIAFFIFAVAMIAETNRAPFDLPEAESELTAGFHTEYSGFRWSLFMLAEYAAMIAVSSIAVTLWIGGWLRPFPNLLAGPAWDFIFALFPGLTFLALGAIGFIGFVRMPRHSYFKIQKMGLGGFAGVLALIGVLLFAVPVIARGSSNAQLVSLAAGLSAVYWFIAKVAVFMYLYIWYRATFPRYRFDQLMQVGWKVLLPIALGVLIATAALGIAIPAIDEWLKGRVG